MDPNQFNIIHKEVQNQSRTIKEAMFICVQDPPSIATLANTNFLTSGINYYSHCQYSNPNQPNHVASFCPPTGSPFIPPTGHSGGGHLNFPYIYPHW